jgi:phosphatidylglycerol:prolipoprotein diacylglycerol transferase
VYSFGVMVALGFLAAWYITRAYLAPRNLDGDLTSSMFLAALVGGVAGGRVYYALEHVTDLRADPLGLLLAQGGLTFYGGLLGGAFAVAAVIAWRRAPFSVCSDAAAPGITAGYLLGRIGCQLSGDGDYGRASSLPWAMSYPHGTVPTLERVHPTPVYDVLLSLPILLVLLRMQRRPHRDGAIFGIFLLLSGVERFVTEFTRRNPVVWAGLTEAQFWSVGLIVAGLFVPRLFRTIDAQRGLLSEAGAQARAVDAR